MRSPVPGSRLSTGRKLKTVFLSVMALAVAVTPATAATAPLKKSGTSSDTGKKIRK